MKKNALLGAIFVVAAFASCKKESDSTDNSSAAALFGSWKFIGMNAKTTADLTVTSPATNEKLQTITTSQYTTSDNVGTMVFSADKIDSKGIGYTAYGTINVTGYYNGAYDPDQSIDNMEFSQAVDPTTVSYAYQAVGSDSLYLSSGALVNVTDGTTTVGGGASGCKYTIKNDTLSIISRSNVNQNSTSSGITYKALGTVYAEMKLVKE